MNKKGAISVARRVIFGVAMLIVVVILVRFAAELLGDPAADTVQTISCNIRDVASVGGGLGTETYFWPKPGRREASVAPDRWENCNSDLLKEHTAAKTEEEEHTALRSCAVQQIAEIALRCWKSRGSGKLDCGDSTCFVFTVRDYPFDINIGFPEVRDFMRNNNVSRTDTPYSDVITIKRVIPKYKYNVTNDIAWTAKYWDGWAPGWDLEWLGWDVEYDTGDYIVFKKEE